MKRIGMLAAGCVVGSGLFILWGQEPTARGAFTQAQADAGRVAVETTCGQCHTPTLLGRNGKAGELPPIGALSVKYQEFIGPRGWVPPLAGDAFIDKWGSWTVGKLIARFGETAEYFLPGADEQTTVNITAYVLQMNGAKAGTHAMAASDSELVRSLVR